MGKSGISPKRDPLIVPPDTRPRAGREEKLTALWEQLLAQDHSNTDLIKVIHHVPSFARKAWEELLKRKPSNDDLLECITSTTSSYITAEAGRLLLEGTFTNMDLVRLVCTSTSASEKAMEKLKRLFDVGLVNGGELQVIIAYRGGWNLNNKFREQAARMLLELSPPGKAGLVCIMQNCHEVLAKQAWRKFCMRGPSNDDLCFVLKEVRQDSIIKYALVKLLKSKPTNDELILVISTTKSLPQAEIAYRRLLDQEPTQQQLCQLIVQAPNIIRAQVWPRFLECMPSEEGLLSLINNRQFVEEAAAEIMRRPEPSKKALRLIIKESSAYSDPAARLLLRGHITAEDLRLISFRVSALQSEVQKRMPPKSAKEIVEQMRSIHLLG